MFLFVLDCTFSSWGQSLLLVRDLVQTVLTLSDCLKTAEFQFSIDMKFAEVAHVVVVSALSVREDIFDHFVNEEIGSFELFQDVRGQFKSNVYNCFDTIFELGP